MQNARPRYSAFTLIELILVMSILVLVAAAVAPSLRGFGIGRKNHDAASQIVALAQYARTQAIAEGRTYRMNFDPANRAYWLTVQTDGVFQPPTNDFGQHFQAAEGVTMAVDVSPQANTLWNFPDSVQQVQTGGPPLVEQPNSHPNMLMQNPHDPGDAYVEFQSSGRTDPVQIRLTDSLGHTIEVACSSATEMFRVVPPEEMSQ